MALANIIAKLRSKYPDEPLLDQLDAAAAPEDVPPEAPESEAFEDELADEPAMDAPAEDEPAEFGAGPADEEGRPRPKRKRRPPFPMDDGADEPEQINGTF